MNIVIWRKQVADNVFADAERRHTTITRASADITLFKEPVTLMTIMSSLAPDGPGRSQAA